MRWERNKKGVACWSKLLSNNVPSTSAFVTIPTPRIVGSKDVSNEVTYVG